MPINHDYSNEMIDILILFYNKVDQTVRCIDSFLKSGQHIYVLNNGSEQTQKKKLYELYGHHERVNLMDAGKNLGVSGGRNYLIVHSTAQWLLFVDNDITVRQEDTWVNLFSDYLKIYPDALVVSPRLFNVHENAYAKHLNVIIEEKSLKIDTGQFQLSNCFPGGASIVHRSIFEKYGMYDEDMFVGFEDYEYAIRALLSEHGRLFVHQHEAIDLIHDHQFQKKNKDKEAVRQRYNNERMKASFDRLVDKYGIQFDHDWQWWTSNQLSIMTESPFMRKLKILIARIRKS